MTPTEVSLARSWKAKGQSLHTIAKLLRRDRKSLRPYTKNKGKKLGALKKGRPKAVTPAMFRELKRALDHLLKKANGQREVTVSMVKAKAQCPACARVIRQAFHAHGVHFRKLREKPLLTKQDVAARAAFAETHSGRTAQQWVQHPHAIIDNKMFQVFADARGREHVARRGVRGAWREAGGEAAVKEYLVKPKGTVKYPARGVMITAAVINGRVRMWHVVPGRWNSKQAVDMYKGPLRRALESAYPDHACRPRAKWVVLEDNDPAGYKARAALDAKAEIGIQTMDLPRRSPDLNVLDYSLWHAINTRMHAQEAKFPKSKKEARDEFLKRLRSTALKLPTSVVTRAVRDMKRRVGLIKQNVGGLIDE